MSVKLTKSVIDQIRYEKSDGKQDIRWDTQLSGFGIRVYPSEKKTFVVSYRVQGRKRIMTIGRFGILTVDQARDKAIQALACATSDIDPLSERQITSGGMTMGDFAVEYLERHAKPHKKSWYKDDEHLKRIIVSAFGSRKISSITRNDVATLHSKLSQCTPYQANRVIALLSSMFERAREWGYFEVDNPARKIKKNREKKRDRWVTPEELPRLVNAIEEEQNLYARNAIWLYLLTGLRKSELLRAKWEDVGWNTRVMRVPETKADRAHHVPLSEPALKILGELPHTADNPYIFPGRNPGAAMVNIDRPWYRIRDAAGLKDVRLHDLRRTVGSWLAQQGNSLHLIGRVLNHSNLTTTQVYAHFGEDHVRVALEHHAERLLSVVKATDVDKATESSKPGQSCKVIPFKPRASNSSKFSKAQ